MATYLFWRKLFAHLLIFLSRRRWPPLPTYLEGDGHLLPFHVGRDGNISTYFGQPIYLFIYLPIHYLFRRRWPRPLTYLGRDGHLCTYLGKDGHLFILFTHLLTYLLRGRWPPTYLFRRRWPPLGDGHLYRFI